MIGRADIGLDRPEHLERGRAVVANHRTGIPKIIERASP
jgi:hypothetical protein